MYPSSWGRGCPQPQSGTGDLDPQQCSSRCREPRALQQPGFWGAPLRDGASRAAVPNHGWPRFGAVLGSPLSPSLGPSPLLSRIQRGHGCRELRAVSARWRGTHTWPRSRRGRPPAVPRRGGARGALAPRRRPHELRGRAFSVFSLPSQPHSRAHPILAALQKQALEFTGLERRVAARGRLAGRAPSRFPLDTGPAPAELPAPSARIRFLLSAGARGKALLYRPAGRPRSQSRRGAAAAWAAMGELPLALLALAALRCAGAPGKISAFLTTSQGPPSRKISHPRHAAA